MLLIYSDEQRKQLTLLNGIDEQSVEQFCRVAIDFLQSGTNKKVYQSAAQKLQISPSQVEQMLKAVMNVFTESIKSSLNDVDFQDSLLAAGVTENVQKLLLATYVAEAAQLRTVMSSMTLKLPEYHDMQWRFDVQLTSRRQLDHIQPMVLIKLQLLENGMLKTHLLQCDIPNLVHLTKTLEEALSELKTQHVRRMIRNL